MDEALNTVLQRQTLDFNAIRAANGLTGSDGGRHFRALCELHREDLIVDVDGPRFLAGDNRAARAVADAAAAVVDLVGKRVGSLYRRLAVDCANELSCRTIDVT